MTKICSDCKYFWYGDGRCNHPKATAPDKKGNGGQILAPTMREHEPTREDSIWCGSAARFFEPKASA